MDMHATTILAVRRGDKVVIAGDGQVTMGNTVMKHGARKLRRLGEGQIIRGETRRRHCVPQLVERLGARSYGRARLLPSRNTEFGSAGASPSQTTQHTKRVRKPCPRRV